MMPIPTIVSVQVGMPREIPLLPDDPAPSGPRPATWRSAIYKRPVSGPVHVGRTTVSGDGQADLRFHGGEDRPILAYCARAGVHYVDTTGEQSFVARAVLRYRATAEASGACVVPAMAYEIALADWAAHIASETGDGPVSAISICYGLRSPGGPFASRGTMRSALAQFAGGDAMQFVDGALVRELAAEKVRTFEIETLGERAEARTCVSFPGPEAIVVPAHTGAQTVRTFMPVGGAFLLHRGRALVPGAARIAGRLAGRLIARAPEGPDEGARARTGFEIIVEVERGRATSVLRVVGHDPYGLTAEIQALASERAVTGAVTARGVVAPSVAFEPRSSLAALRAVGVSLRPKSDGAARE